MAGTYISQQDITDAYGADRLSLLADDGTGNLDVAKIDGAIARAEATTDTYIGKRYALPLAAVPDILVRINVDLAVYYLATDESLMSELVDNRKKDAIADLDKIAAGKIELGLALADVPSGANQPEVAPNAPDRTFTTDSLKHYTSDRYGGNRW